MACQLKEINAHLGDFKNVHNYNYRKEKSFKASRKRKTEHLGMVQMKDPNL